MKRWMAVILVLVLALGLCGCGKEDTSGQTQAAAVAGAQYAGEWNANQLTSNIDEVRTYTTSVLKLNEDGTGTYQDAPGTWVYSEEDGVITFTLTDPMFVMDFTVTQDKKGITVLQYYQDSYYRPENFEPKKNPTEPTE